ncbi:GGDEF domain-containing protein [Solirubrobacter ginsenosidimutans]|uniref:GGDEF domain-containing protein n=1 Tax=Solirubrobacter ginsenosidimutans TaxID=490573 RepID=A0A9X3S2V4_9ACTN|nr:GGDEF domain-containing protein [Solirubrobacter ginsenosidimutans]MDA0162707.1 GGDEF domain-containing protein [Solirubrobacter ginsenosidimutans]
MRVTAGAVALLAGTMLIAWLAGSGVAMRTDNLEPMSPLSCAGFLAGAVGVFALGARPIQHRLAVAAGTLMFVCGVAGLVDDLASGGDAINAALLGVDARISVLTSIVLTLLGGAQLLNGHGWPLTRWLALAAAAIGGAAGIGFLLGVPIFYGPSREVQMSWQAALCATLLAIGLAGAHPGSSTRLLSDRGLAGRFTRRVVPAVLGIPILSGSLCMAAARAGWFSYSVAAWLMTLAAVTGLATLARLAVAELEREERQLTELATRDPLTGAYNRRSFLAEAQRAAERSQRYGEAAAVAVIDLDHFKEINDSWGHAVGDEALVRSFRALRSRLRSSDVLGRIGGDEFAALVLHVDEAAALQVAGEMRDAVARVGMQLAAEGHANRLSASVGIAPLHVDDPRDVDALIDLADQRMYLAKRAKALTE